MAYNQHEQHVGRRKGFEMKHRTQPDRIIAVGETSISTGYSVMEEERMRRADARETAFLHGDKSRERWVVEFRHPKGVWLTASRAEQGKTLEGARRIVAAGGSRYRMLYWRTDGVNPAIIEGRD